MADMTENFRGALDTIRADLEDSIDVARDASRELTHDVIGTVRQNPVTALAVAVALGFAIGYLARRD